MVPTSASPSEPGSLGKHLHCSICMDTFTDPVTTACGHSFCKLCLDRSIHLNDSVCPLCKNYISRIPDVNIVLRDIVEQLKEKYTGAAGEVACDVCSDKKLKAKKSCLVCLASYCSVHLHKHLSTERLKGHKLVEPVENLDARACLKHGRPLELYSRERQACICVLCMEGQEEVVSTEDEWKKKRVSYHNNLWICVLSLDSIVYILLTILTILWHVKEFSSAQKRSTRGKNTFLKYYFMFLLQSELDNTKTELNENIDKRKTKTAEIEEALKSCKVSSK